MSDDVTRDGPAWPPTMWLSPTKLKTYRTCPHWARLQYVDQIPAQQPLSVAFEEGKLAHSILSDAARRIQKRTKLRSDDEIENWAQRGLPLKNYPSSAAHEASTRKLKRWVDYGVTQISTGAKLLEVEKKQHRSLPLDGTTTRFTVSTRPDLILVHEDESAPPSVEIMDFKTGKVHLDDIAPVTMRFALKPLLQTLTDDTANLQVRYTWLFLEYQQREALDLDHEHALTAWQEVISLAKQLVNDREWKQTPSHACLWCPYRGNPCTAYAEFINRDARED